MAFETTEAFAITVDGGFYATHITEGCIKGELGRWMLDACIEILYNIADKNGMPIETSTQRRALVQGAKHIAIHQSGDGTVFYKARFKRVGHNGRQLVIHTLHDNEWVNSGYTVLEVGAKITFPFKLRGYYISPTNYGVSMYMDKAIRLHNPPGKPMKHTNN